ncbi:MAG: hypothetical protein F4X74_04040 [Acidimicrobiia bacterium]|nr:hypothetical protein [Acidimicrobiia bacterium]
MLRGLRSELADPQGCCGLFAWAIIAPLLLMVGILALYWLARLILLAVREVIEVLLRFLGG